VLDVPGLDVEREEFRRQPTLLHTFDVRAIRRRGSSTQIEIVVGHRGGHVVMRVDNDRAPVDLQRPLPESFVPRLGNCGNHG
jgi:hypothetical protein